MYKPVRPGQDDGIAGTRCKALLKNRLLREKVLYKQEFRTWVQIPPAPPFRGRGVMVTHLLWEQE